MADDLNFEELLQATEAKQPTEKQDEPKLKVGDQEYTLSQIEEWKRGAMMQADYTRKTQEIADERRRMQQQLQEAEQYKHAAAQLQQKDPYLFAHAQQVLTGQMQPHDQYADDPYMKEIVQIKQALSAWGQYTQDNVTKLAEQQEALVLERELNSLGTKYPRMDREKVLAAIMADPSISIEDVARKTHEEMGQKLTSELKNLAEQQKSRKNAMFEGSGGRTTGILKPQEFKSRDEVEQATIDFLNRIP